MPSEQEITVKATVPEGNECYKLSSICLYWNVDLAHGVDTCLLFRVPMYHSNKCTECLDACKEEVEPGFKFTEETLKKFEYLDKAFVAPKEVCSECGGKEKVMRDYKTVTGMKYGQHLVPCPKCTTKGEN